MFVQHFLSFVRLEMLFAVMFFSRATMSSETRSDHLYVCMKEYLTCSELGGICNILMVEYNILKI